MTEQLLKTRMSDIRSPVLDNVPFDAISLSGIFVSLLLKRPFLCVIDINTAQAVKASHRDKSFETSHGVA